MVLRFWAIALTFSLVSCSVRAPIEPVSQKTALVRVSGPVIERDSGDDHSLLRAIDQSLAYFTRVGLNGTLHFGGLEVSTSEYLSSLHLLRDGLIKYRLTPQFFDFVSREFTVYRSVQSPLLLTGYYLPELRGSRTKTSQFKYPIYKTPSDLLTLRTQDFPLLTGFEGLPVELKARLGKDGRLLPYYSREAIDQAALANRKLELLWVDDPIDLFFMHIQGSGIVSLRGGEKIFVSFADKNGAPYRAIGKLLIDRNLATTDQMSMQFIRKYLADHPEEITEIFNYNPSYVFFREVSPGPIGSLGVVLTPMRSIATDRALFPKGAIGVLQYAEPEFSESGQLVQTKPTFRFVLNQDTGGAIRGAGRADLYTGAGTDAALLAGHLKHEGNLYFLLSNQTIATLPPSRKSTKAK